MFLIATTGTSKKMDFNRYIDQGVAELVLGILFINEVHMLNIECFTYLNHALGFALSPSVFFLTNRGGCKIRSIYILSPHDLPVDLLNRMPVLRMLLHSVNETVQITGLRATVEDIKVEEDALWLLGEVST